MSVDGIVGNTPTMGIPTSEIKKITEVGLYDPNLRGELIDCKDWEIEHVESFITSLDEQHDLFLPIGFMESIEKDPFQLYCDTDSVVGNSKITYLDNNKTNCDTIENLWERLNSVDVDEYKEVKETKNVFDLGLLTPTISKYGEPLEYKKIKKIIRHKITKKLYRIKTDNNEVIITEDHSLVVLRNNEIVGITIKELKDGDKLLEIQNPA